MSKKYNIVIYIVYLNCVWSCFSNEIGSFFQHLSIFVTYIKIFIIVSIELIRKRSEHNEGEIGTLEELSLHQEDITKIENLQNWCKNLQILLLQSNLIFKIGKFNNL